MPPLVIVSGSPGSGKSTLAGRLAAELGLPQLMKDEVASRLLDAGTGAVLESNFYRGRAESALEPLAARATAVQVHCGGDAATIVRRFWERAERGERHAGHADRAALPRLREYLATGRCEPLDLGVPTLRVDTTAAPFETILAFVRRHACGASWPTTV